MNKIMKFFNLNKKKEKNVNDYEIMKPTRDNNRDFMFVCNTCNKIYELISQHYDEQGHRVELDTISLYCKKCKKIVDWGKSCSNCGISFGTYKCDECFFMTFEKAYHCKDCRRCKIGDKDKAFHCHGCNNCLHTYFKDNHKCRKYDKDDTCYICLEPLWTSNLTVKGLPCSHNVHKKCFYEYYDNLKYKSDACCGLCREKICYK